MASPEETLAYLPLFTWVYALQINKKVSFFSDLAFVVQALQTFSLGFSDVKKIFQARNFLPR